MLFSQLGDSMKQIIGKIANQNAGYEFVCYYLFNS